MGAKHFSGNKGGKARKRGTSGGWQISLWRNHESDLLQSLCFISDNASVRENILTDSVGRNIIVHRVDSLSLLYNI